MKKTITYSLGNLPQFGKNQIEEYISNMFQFDCWLTKEGEDNIMHIAYPEGGESIIFAFAVEIGQLLASF